MQTIRVRYYFIFFLLLIIAVNGCRKHEKNSETRASDSTAQDRADLTQKKEIKKSSLKFQGDSALVTFIAVMNTSMGKITFGLFGKDAPVTVKNFVGLSKKGFYSGILFHRVAKDFVIQTGDPNTKKSKKSDWGKGGKSFFGKEFSDELDPATPSYKNGYQKGIVAMANRGSNTNTSQFFICLKDAKNLEKNWTIFGKVMDGMDVVEKIGSVPIDPGPFDKNDGSPKKPIKIFSVSIKEVK